MAKEVGIGGTDAGFSRGELQYVPTKMCSKYLDHTDDIENGLLIYTNDISQVSEHAFQYMNNLADGLHKPGW